MRMGPMGEAGRALTEMERAAGAGMAARGGSMPVGGTDVSGVVNPRRLAETGYEQHKEQIQEAVNGIATGDVTAGFLKKLLNKFGWTQSSEEGKFRDPEGNDHTISAIQEQGNAPGPVRSEVPGGYR